MATGSSEGQSPCKMMKTTWEKLGLEEEGFFHGEQPIAVPGFFKLFTMENVRKELDKIRLCKLHPVVLKPKNKAESTLFTSKDLSFSTMNCCVSVSCEQEIYEFLHFFLPQLKELGSHQHSPPKVIAVIYHIINHITSVYKYLQKEWNESPVGAMESSDQNLWSIICSIIIEGNSAVFKECTIKGETLPHGDIDIVAGQINTRGEIIWRFGVQIFAEDEEFFLDSHIGILAKTKRTLTTVPPTPQIVVEALAFTEVLENAAGKPVVFFAGTREAFRPYIRVKELDLLLTTPQSIVWWNVKKNAPELTGVVLLIVLMLGMSAPEYKLQISTDILHKNERMKSAITGWNQYYEGHEMKYTDQITAKKRQPSQSTSIEPRQTDPLKIFGSEQELEGRIKNLSEDSS